MTTTLRQPLTAGRLDRLGEELTVHEQAVMDGLATAQVMTTAQVARLVFSVHEAATALRLARRHLERLRQFGLVRRFADRARDRRVGAPGYVHALTAAGLRLSGGRHGLGVRQRTAWRPSYAFLSHRLAISELYVRLVEQERAGGARLREFRSEPDCWRPYTGPAEQRLVLKPDALVRLGIANAEISSFAEIDLGSERPATIADKCRAYHTYELSGEEQRRYGIFPGVVFIVPTQERARVIGQVVEHQPADTRELFTVATEERAIAALAQADVTAPPAVRPPP
jgi:Replication-relaxation